MINVKRIIERNLDRFPEFEYYYLIIEKLERNREKHPEIAIECSKSLIEGISKTIIIALNKSESEDTLKKKKLAPIYTDAINILVKYDETFEIDYISSFNHLIKLIGEIRTHRGDISHGKPVPKSQKTSIPFATAIIGFSSSFLVYILEHYFSLEIIHDEKIPYDKKENESFNKMLDELYSFPSICYSQALYEQDYETYLEELQNYQETIKEEVVFSKKSNDIIIKDDEILETTISENQKDENIKSINLNYNSEEAENLLVQ